MCCQVEREVRICPLQASSNVCVFVYMRVVGHSTLPRQTRAHLYLFPLWAQQSNTCTCVHTCWCYKKKLMFCLGWFFSEYTDMPHAVPLSVWLGVQHACTLCMFVIYYVMVCVRCAWYSHLTVCTKASLNHCFVPTQISHWCQGVETNLLRAMMHCLSECMVSTPVWVVYSAPTELCNDNHIVLGIRNARETASLHIHLWLAKAVKSETFWKLIAHCNCFLAIIDQLCNCCVSYTCRLPIVCS